MLSLNIRPAAAVNRAWKAPVFGSFTTASNWTPAGVPDTSDTATFNLGGTGQANYYTVSTSNNFGIGALKVINDFVTFDLGNRPFSVSSFQATPAMIVGDNGGLGVVTIQNGNWFSQSSAIGYGALSTGEVTLNGRGNWSSPSAYVGYAGVGTMNVQSMSRAGVQQGQAYLGYLAGSSGTVNVTDSGATYIVNSSVLTIGEAGTGLMNIRGGASLQTSQSTIILGDQSGSYGTINVDGAGTAIYQDSGATNVIGGSGTGELSLSSGAKFNSAVVKIAAAPGGVGSVIVDGVGSAWTNSLGSTATVTVGSDQSAAAAMTIRNGASYNQDNGTFLVTGAGTSSVTMDGAGTTATFSGSARLDVASGALYVKHGATINTSGNYGMGIGSPAAPTPGLAQLYVDGAGSRIDTFGPINITAASATISGGGVLHTQQAFTISRFSTVDIQQGTLQASNLMNNGNLHIDGTVLSNVDSRSISVISGAGSISGSLTTTGAISPGNSPGKLTVGSLILSRGASYDFDINNAIGVAGASTGWDLLAVQSTTEFAFTITAANPLVVRLHSLTADNTHGSVANFDGRRDYHWTFLSSGGAISGFDPTAFRIDTTDFANPAGGTFHVTQAGNSLVLDYAAPEPPTVILAAPPLLLLLRKLWRRANSKRPSLDNSPASLAR